MIATVRTAFVSILLSVGVFLMPVSSWGHGYAGKRFFPTTFQVDDPFISDEFSIFINRIKGSDSKTIEIGVDYSKRVLPKFGLEFHAPYIHERSLDGASANGWDNIGVGAKWQFLTNETHELILSTGVDIDIGGTGARRIAESFSTISPAFSFGKGFGDLPESVNYLRPFAVTGTMGPSFPTRRMSTTLNPETGETESEQNPTTFSWAFSFQYNLMYLQSFVKDIGLGNPFRRMILVAEFPMETCVSAECKGETTGAVNPGVVWFGKKVELGVAAQFPLNSSSGHGVGVLGLIHLFIDDLFPKSLGKPIFH
jgi:hypothetical protein